MAASTRRSGTRRFVLSLILTLLVAAVILPATATGLPVSPTAHRAPAAARSGAATGELAYVKAKHVWTIGADGSGATQLTKGTGEDTIPVWSPDGQTVAFVRSGSSGHNATVRTVPAAGGTPQVVYRSAIPTAIYTEITGLSYTPDGTQLTFAEAWATNSPGDIGRCRIVSLDLATGATRVLLSRNGGFGTIIGAMWQIAWSPDGTTLAIAQSGQDSEGGQTWLYRPSDGDLSRVGTTQASFADWSPGGDALLLSTFTQPSSRVQLLTTGGTVLRTLARGGGWTGAPSVNDARFSWDGLTVAYTRTPRSGIAQLWLMSATGTGKHMVTTGASPAWR